MMMEEPKAIFQVKIDLSMKNELIRGITRGLILYGLGALLTVILHLIFGWDYPHAPPMSSIAVLLTLIIGMFRAFITAVRMFTDRTDKAQGELIVHLVVAILIAVCILWLSRGY